MKFYKVAKYYYYPGWHEPGTNLDFLFNRRAYESLPRELRAVIDQAALDCERWMTRECIIKNREAMKNLLERHRVKLMRFPDQVLDILEGYSREIYEELAAHDPTTAKVHRAYLDVQQKLGERATSHAAAYYNNM